MFRQPAELGRRNVIRVATVYAGAATGILDTRSIVLGG